MGTTRRSAILAAFGLAALPGCGALSSTMPEGRSTPMAPTSTAEPTRSEPTTTERSETATPTAEEDARPVADLYVYEQDGGFSVVRDDEVIARRSGDLGGVINDAQAALSTGSILVDSAGPSRTSIVHEDDIDIAGIGGRTTLIPAQEVDGSFNLYHTTDGPTGARCESVIFDMDGRGRTAIRSEGFEDVAYEGIHIRNAASHGLALAGGREATVRTCRFSGIKNDAIRLNDAAGVTIEECTSVGASYGVHAIGSSDVVVRGFRSRDNRLNGIAIYDYTENWRVINCRAVGDRHTPFAASPARNGSFVGCVAVGTTADREGGFEIEYKAGHDSMGREAPVEGCAVVSCTAIDCNMGFYAREDDANKATNTPVIRPRFMDCTAIGCETGLFIDENVIEARVEGFTAVECATDIVDSGIRTVIEGRSENAGDPAVGGQWNGHERTAAAFDVVIDDTENGISYTATESGTWEQIA